MEIALNSAENIQDANSSNPANNGNSSLELLTSHPNAHSLTRHGGNVTDQELQQRALSGIAPDGHVKYDKKTGKPVIPPMSSAFHSDQLLIETDQTIRNSEAFKNKIDQLPEGLNIISLTPNELGDLGVDLGRGYKRVSGSRLNPDLQGAPQKVDNLSSAIGTWEKNPTTGKWETITLYPAEAP